MWKSAFVGCEQNVCETSRLPEIGEPPADVLRLQPTEMELIPSGGVDEFASAYVSPEQRKWLTSQKAPRPTKSRAEDEYRRIVRTSRAVPRKCAHLQRALACGPPRAWSIHACASRDP